MSSEYVWYNDISRQFLARDYLLPGWTLDQRVTHMAKTAQRFAEDTCHSKGHPRLKGFGDRILHAMRRGWWSFSTPVWTNFGAKRGLPISCFATHVGDSIASMLRGHAEMGMMSKHGGGTAAYFGAIRPRGAPITDNGFASGPLHYLNMWETLINTVTQGSTRNANMTAWMDVEHPSIMEFLKIRGDHHPIQKIHPGICIGNDWMRKAIARDPSTLDVLAEIITQRANTGHPFILFRDTVNSNTVDVYRENSMPIRHSNLCTEILLPTSEEESFVCCLSSMNAATYDEWKDTDTVADMVLFLDCVLTDFISRGVSVPFMERAVRFAQRHRALGIGVLGWHTLLQKKNLAFGSLEAGCLNVQLFRQINTQAWDASKDMAEYWGAPSLLANYERRHSTLTAIAPTVSSASILGQVSRCIEPILDNYHIVDRDKLKYTWRNPILHDVLAQHASASETVWDSILRSQGSVQHLSCLTNHERDVFKTFSEISPADVITGVAQRQPHIDQGQSTNVFIHPSISVKDQVKLLIKAWEVGCKTLYYQNNENASQAFSRDILACTGCAA